MISSILILANRYIVSLNTHSAILQISQVYNRISRLNALMSPGTTPSSRLPFAEYPNSSPSLSLFSREGGALFISYIPGKSPRRWNGIFKSSQGNVNNSRDGGVKPNGWSCSSRSSLLGIFSRLFHPPTPRLRSLPRPPIGDGHHLGSFPPWWFINL